MTAAVRGAVAIVGSPKARSKTLTAARAILEALARHGIGVGGAAAEGLINLGEPGLTRDLGRAAAGDPAPRVAEALARVAASRVVVLATPTYRGTYTGLLKLFLDLVPQGGLAGKAVVPLMLGASSQHRLALDQAFPPLVREMGADARWRGLYLLDRGVDPETERVSPELSEEIEALAADLAAAVALKGET